MNRSNSHNMRLRSRSSNVNNASIPTATNSRSVLGDVSNRSRQSSRNIDKESGKGKIIKKRLKTDETSNIDIENSENRAEVRRSQRVRNNSNSTGPTKRKNPSPQAADKKKIKNNKHESQDTIIECPSEGTSDTRERICAGSEEQRETEPHETTLVPKAYRLQRSSFDGKTHTYGIAPHDGNTNDVLEVSNYVTDLFQHLYVEEALSRPTPYMADQRDINSKMRRILIDWLIEVHMKFRLEPDTLYLCVNIIDRYCKIVAVPRNRLQLVGVTALLIACKYEEIYPPEVRECVYITDRAYQRWEVLAMEHDILGKLNYRISVPTAYPFMLRFLKLTNASPLTKHAANYYMERTLQEHDLLRFKPSLLCASSVILALCNPDIARRENREPSDVERSIQILLEYTCFNMRDIKTCAANIAEKIGEEPVTASRRQLNSVKKKYDTRKYHHVSRVDLPNANHILYVHEDNDLDQSRE